MAMRTAKRVAAYKTRLTESLPSQIELWTARENRLLSVVTGAKGISVAALLVRECPDPPIELDPDTDEEEEKQPDTIESVEAKQPDSEETTDDDERTTDGEGETQSYSDDETQDFSKPKIAKVVDPTTRPWTSTDAGSSLPSPSRNILLVPPPHTTSTSTNKSHTHTLQTHTLVAAAALNISEKQRVRLQGQSVAMAQYCSLMCNRAKAMLNFITTECPETRGDVLTAFRQKYHQYGLRQITLTVIKKMSKCLLGCMHCTPSPLSPHSLITHTHNRYKRPRYIHAVAIVLPATWVLQTGQERSIYGGVSFATR